MPLTPEEIKRSELRYAAAISRPFYRIHSVREDGKGWEFSRNVDRYDEALHVLHGVITEFAENEVRAVITCTYCEPLIYAVPTGSLHKYGPAGARENARRASAA